MRMPENMEKGGTKPTLVTGMQTVSHLVKDWKDHVASQGPDSPKTPDPIANTN